jgi:hypothetical protein
VLDPDEHEFCWLLQVGSTQLQLRVGDLNMCLLWRSSRQVIAPCAPGPDC